MLWQKAQEKHQPHPKGGEYNLHFAELLVQGIPIESLNCTLGEAPEGPLSSAQVRVGKEDCSFNQTLNSVESPHFPFQWHLHFSPGLPCCPRHPLLSWTISIPLSFLLPPLSEPSPPSATPHFCASLRTLSFSPLSLYP